MSLKKLITATVTGSALALGGMGVASAALVFDAALSAQGAGFGATNNILTIHLSGGAGDASAIETGEVAWNGTADVLTGA